MGLPLPLPTWYSHCDSRMLCYDTVISYIFNEVSCTYTVAFLVTWQWPPILPTRALVGYWSLSSRAVTFWRLMLMVRFLFAFESTKDSNHYRLLPLVALHKYLSTILAQPMYRYLCGPRCSSWEESHSHDGDSTYLWLFSRLVAVRFYLCLACLLSTNYKGCSSKGIGPNRFIYLKEHDINLSWGQCLM